MAQNPWEPIFERKVYCNRTLNLRSIGAIGYDMDYTLVHYHVEKWEEKAYSYLQQQLLSKGWPADSLKFNAQLVCRGLVIDRENGNLVKPNRFGFIKKAMHGTRPLTYEEQRKTYSRVIVDLNESRWVFLNTLFSLSEGCMYAQLVDLLDEKKIQGVIGYSDLYDVVRNALEQAHVEGRLKAEIIANPEEFVELDENAPLALMDQKQAGKRLLLITNSEWHFTQSMMTYAFDQFLPNGMTWRDLFELVIVAARKPSFFQTSTPVFEVVTEDGLLKPVVGDLQPGRCYFGGSASQVEKYLNLSGDEILYVGDHLFGDVHVTKNVLRWRTALVLRELEAELHALQVFDSQEEKLQTLMEKKRSLESEYWYSRLVEQRQKKGYGPSPETTLDANAKRLEKLKLELEALDQPIMKLAQQSSELSNSRWGLLMRAGNDKSHLAYQVERYADVYTSRVSNFLSVTPFAYLRSTRGSLPHDRGGMPNSGD